MGSNWLLDIVKMTDDERLQLLDSVDSIVGEVDRKVAKGMKAHSAVIEVVEGRLRILRKKKEEVVVMPRVNK